MIAKFIYLFGDVQNGISRNKHFVTQSLTNRNYTGQVSHITINFSSKQGILSSALCIVQPDFK